jgi:hypothetical protein
LRRIPPFSFRFCAAGRYTYTAGPASCLKGSIRINIVAGPELKGIGETDHLLTVDGQIGNAVRINFQ